MTRTVRVASAQLGPTKAGDPRDRVVARLVALLEDAAARGCHIVVFPELALTPYFPRWSMDAAEAGRFFETEMPSAATQPLFDRAAELGVGFYLGYAEAAHEDGRWKWFNTAILVDHQARIVGKYRKVHLPGHAHYDASRRFQLLEKGYFAVGDRGFPVWRTMGGVMGMCLCNDRRWPETFRVMGLQGVELVMLGYNTPAANAHGGEPSHVRMFHNHLTMQAGAYQNATWVASAAKAGEEAGMEMLAGSCIIAPSGEIVAQAYTMDDELITADCDLEACRFNKETIFNFAQHRRVEHYDIITRQAGATPPEEEA